MTVGNFIRYARTHAVTTKSDAFALTAKQDVGCTPARFLRQAPALSRPLERRRFLRRKETHHVYHHHDVASCEVFPAQAFDHPASVDRLRSIAGRTCDERLNVKVIRSSPPASEEIAMQVQAPVIEMVGFSQSFGQHRAVGTLHLALIRGLLGPRMQRARHW
jgi:hypothetical protein